MLKIVSRSVHTCGKRTTSRLFILGILLVLTSAKVYERCELARTLKNFGMDGYFNYSLANWVCMAHAESSYNTSAINHNMAHHKIWSTDYGIFQINSKWWCKDQKTKGSKNICMLNCIDLLNDYLENDCKCAKIIVRESQGMEAWVGWVKRCKGRDVESFVRGCHL
ncbi:lysozyme C [Narcine bancroftii]|uniref:lysozyme C n=1 Tax=Narcine bancroftii TaxID=1343680 RepID=UPI0038320716